MAKKKDVPVPEFDGWKLVIQPGDNTTNDFFICWQREFADHLEFEYGESLGPYDEDSGGDCAGGDGDQWFHRRACDVAGALIDGKSPFDVYLWRTETRARHALDVVNLALRGGKPWPQWALDATNEGWTPPKGWKP